MYHVRGSSRYTPVHRGLLDVILFLEKKVQVHPYGPHQQADDSSKHAHRQYRTHTGGPTCLAFTKKALNVAHNHTQGGGKGS